MDLLLNKPAKEIVEALIDNAEATVSPDELYAMEDLLDPSVVWTARDIKRLPEEAWDLMAENQVKWKARFSLVTKIVIEEDVAGHLMNIVSDPDYWTGWDYVEAEGDLVKLSVTKMPGQDSDKESYILAKEVQIDTLSRSISRSINYRGPSRYMR